MSRSLLITRPNHDPTTDYLSHWSTKIIDVANRKSYQIYDLLGTKATKYNLDSYLNSHKPNLLVLNGHGSAETIFGHNNEVLISDKHNDLAKFQNSICYARSCLSAITLGKKLVDSGMNCYIGYTTEFVFFRNSQYQARPLLDPIARIFLSPSNLVATTLLKGHPASEAHNRSVRAMKKNLRKILSSNSSPDERNVAVYLWSNANSQVLIGNSTATSS